MSNGSKSRRVNGPPNGPRAPLSLKLREASMLLGLKRREEALQVLADATHLSENKIERAKIANLVAQSQFELGRYQDAAARYDEAARLGADDGLDSPRFLSPSLGKVRCLLKDQKLSQALLEAKNLADLVAKKAASYDELINNAGNGRRGFNELTVPAKPIRPPVALTRIGVTFLEEGYLEAGKGFLERVITLVPNGASRARYFLAQTLLLEGDSERAEKLAYESLLFGKFRAKTIPAWETYINARKASGKPLFDADLFRQFKRGEIGGRAAGRAEILIISELRRHNDSLWVDLALSWRKSARNRDPIIRVEILKMLLSEVKTGAMFASEPARNALELAAAIYREPTLAASESIGLAKVLGVYGGAAGMSLQQIEVWLDRIDVRYGDKYGQWAYQSCALGMTKAKEYENARVVFGSLIDRASESSAEWGKAVWSSAKNEYAYGDYSRSAALYLRFSGNNSMETSLRLQAFLRWIRVKEKSGEDVNEEKSKEFVGRLLASINDYQPMLDAGRQLSLAGPSFRPILDQVTNAATELSLQAFEDSKTTKEALVVLLALSRRQLYDFGHAAKVLEFYNGLSSEKRNWLWSHDSRYWEYLSVVMYSEFRVGSSPRGEEMGRSAFEDPTTPIVGRVFLGVHYGLWLRERYRDHEALEQFSKVLTVSPGHRLASHANYWLGLHSYQEKQIDDTINFLRQARRCLLPRPGLYSEWEVDAKAGLLLRLLSPADETVDLSLYSEDFLSRQEVSLRTDLTGLLSAG